MSDEQQTGLDNPSNVKKILRVFYVLCGLLVVLDFALTRKVEHAFEALPAFYPLYGFVGCVVLVVIAKWMRIVLMREEDYYDDELKRELNADD